MLIPSGRARILGARGETEAALALARRATTVAAELDVPELRALALLSLAEVLRRAKRTAEEADALREALAVYERKGARPAAERVRARLDELAAACVPS